MKKKCCFLSIGFLAALEVSAVIFSTEINLNEPAFPTALTDVSGSSQSYNVLNDSTGAELLALNGDADDITFSFSSSGSNTGWEYQTTSSGRFTASHAYPDAPTENNSGALISNTVTLTFASHLSVTDFSFDIVSGNTAGVTWEYTVIEFLDPMGNPFSVFSVDPYLSHTSETGSPSEGVYVLDSVETVVGVGTSTVSSGVSNPNENFTQTGDLGYEEVSIDPGTEIGGLRLTTYLEDVRGINNSSSSFSSSLIDFSFSGEISEVPEPRAYALVVGMAVCLCGLCRRPRRDTANLIG